MWEPFETHPKNGKWFIASDGERMKILNEPPGCFLGEWEKFKGEWSGAAVSFKPTHWMPVPKLPYNPNRA